ncbi:anti-virulence regulator CigR family protein [Achromobacter sp. Marseille-Q4954]|uniref:anti-virulence regulator CigR family protein n=1 Tax=Achromobacter sp. Marseille-Q4954 TaxID=2942203 RepID=UPI0020741920|nr:anti-virulence regulator CigR family protein [Achromobacter sp. Marseille-Q4954]
MRRTPSMIVATLACAAVLGAPAQAAPPEGKGKPDHAGQGNGNGGGNGNGKNKGQQSQDSGVSVTLSTAGITVSTARSYAVQAGATGYGSLPPGIRKNLARGKPLPPGIAKKMVPGPMLARLPVHPGYEWRVAGSDLILVAIATAVVADVLTGVFN